VYREALAVELRPLCCSVEVAMPVLYKGNPLSHVSMRWDMLVESGVLVELKAVKSRLPAAAARQAARYATNFPDYLTLALNFPDRPDAQVEVG
jgi:GxxExxY protein